MPPRSADLGVLVLAFDPHNPETVYAGTGDGLFRAAGGGGSWTATGPSAPAPFSIFSLPIYSIAIDRQNPSTIYVGVQIGGQASKIYKSADGGASWSARGSGLPDCCGVSVLAIAPQNTDTLYAGSFGYAGDDFVGGVFKSTNGGANWNQLSATSVSSLVIDPANPDTLYAATDAGVFRSTDGGTRWAAVNSGAQPVHVSSLAIDPQNPSRVYAVGSGGVFVITFSPDQRPVRRR